jgi:hypothetical protein
MEVGRAFVDRAAKEIIDIHGLLIGASGLSV